MLGLLKRRQGSFLFSLMASPLWFYLLDFWWFVICFAEITWQNGLILTFKWLFMMSLLFFIVRIILFFVIKSIFLARVDLLFQNSYFIAYQFILKVCIVIFLFRVIPCSIVSRIILRLLTHFIVLCAIWVSCSLWCFHISLLFICKITLTWDRRLLFNFLSTWM